MDQQQQQQKEEEYLDAQRAAAEAVLVGRETLETAVGQEEQLQRAESIADETQYKLDKAGRMLRGMTWSGWVANMFTKDVGPPPDVKTKEPPLVYENVPDSCREAAQAVQNYHANVKVLLECETEEQRDTCRTICNAMYDGANLRVASLKSSKSLEAYQTQFAGDLEWLRERQNRITKRASEMPSLSSSQESSTEGAVSPKRASDNTPLFTNASPEHVAIRQQQDKHLDLLSRNLNEMGYIAGSIHETVARQNQTIDRLDTKSESVLEKTKQVTRRADRLVQSKTWVAEKPTFVARMTIRHAESGKYLAVVNNDVYLVPRLHPETCVWSMWKRKGGLLGLKNKFSDKWIGQNLLGSLVCSSSSFGRREEWEIENEKDWTKTRLLCASAGWGAGGYLMVRTSDHAVHIGGSGVEQKKIAAVWVVSEREEE
jgi:hypothetical protein